MAYANDKGRTFERNLCKQFRKWGYDTEDVRNTGQLDQGDTAVRVGNTHHLFEDKAEARYRLWAYLEEAEDEAENYANARNLTLDLVIPAAIIKRPYRRIGQSFVAYYTSNFGQLIRGTGVCLKQKDYTGFGKKAAGDAGDWLDQPDPDLRVAHIGRWQDGAYRTAYIITLNDWHKHFGRTT